LLNRGRTHQSFLLETKPEGVVVDKDREKRADRRFETSEGETLEEISGPEKLISLEMCQKFSGPVKNYHNDEEEARKLGFPDIVVQGMMSLCFLSEMMTLRFGQGWYSGGRMNVNLVNVLWRGERVSCRGRVLEVSPSGRRQRAQLQVWCEKSDGTKVVVGSASALLA
jgi:acyl dehydratase